MNKIVYFLWISLTTAITVLTAFCIFQPYWYIHDNHIHSFGLTIYCDGVPGSDSGYSREITSRCQPYGGMLLLTHIPSGAWQASLLLFFTGTFSFGTTVILGLVILVREKFVYHINSLVLYLQTSSVLLMIAALVAFPIGLGNHFFRYFCGESAAVYNAGNCSMGWSYMLSIMSVSLSIFCPILWCFRDMKWNDFQFKEYL